MHPPLDTPPEGNGAEAGRSLGERLRELPLERTPPFDWAELQRRARLHERHRRIIQDGSRSPRNMVLVAAALALVVAAVPLAGRLIRGTAGPADQGAAAQSSVARAPIDARDLGGGASRDPDSVLRRAAAAERWLASQPDDEPVVRVSTHLAVTDLEDRIASVDDLLNVERLRNANARVHALQLERAQLVDSLAQVRYAEMLTTEPP
jgi:hypothetical protein